MISVTYNTVELLKNIRKIRSKFTFRISKISICLSLSSYMHDNYYYYSTYTATCCILWNVKIWVHSSLPFIESLICPQCTQKAANSEFRWYKTEFESIFSACIYACNVQVLFTYKWINQAMYWNKPMQCTDTWVISIQELVTFVLLNVLLE